MSAKTVYICTPDAAVRAREIMMVSALLDAIAFAEEMRAFAADLSDKFDDRIIANHIATLRAAIPEAPMAPRSGVLAQLPMEA